MKRASPKANGLTLSSPDEEIRSFLQKRFCTKCPDQKECKRATDALLRRGHKWRDIRRIMEEFSSDPYGREEFY